MLRPLVFALHGFQPCGPPHPRSDIASKVTPGLPGLLEHRNFKVEHRTGGGGYRGPDAPARAPWGGSTPTMCAVLTSPASQNHSAIVHDIKKWPSLGSINHLNPNLPPDNGKSKNRRFLADFWLLLFSDKSNPRRRRNSLKEKQFPSS